MSVGNRHLAVIALVLAAQIVATFALGFDATLMAALAIAAVVIATTIAVRAEMDD